MERQNSVADCIICQHQKTAGICILGMSICPQCEEELVASKATHSGYDIYVERLRVLWRRIFDADAKAGGSAGLAVKSMEAVECIEPSTG
ncbi:MAG: hypothetical protein GX063_08750 [Firmicutes bacterium]|nr:hypothetical protein [Bacillota bacterium]